MAANEILMNEDQQNALDQEAIRWLVVLRDDEVTVSDHEEFERWLATSADHKAAWRWACEVWEDADKAAPAIRERLATQRGSVIAFARKESLASKSFGKWLPIAAAFCLFAGGAVVLSNPGLLAQEQTSRGEIRPVSLPDGSVAEMGSESSLSFSTEGQQRVVTLYSGEAHFKVAPNPDKPFIVRAKDGSIMALGTAFNVKLLPTSVNIAVTEHVVEVVPPYGERFRLSNGQQATYGAAGVSAVAPSDAASATAWQRKRLVLQNVQLQDVLADVDRYRAGRIIVLDEAINAIPVTAVLDISDPEAALSTIERTLPVKVARFGSILTLISAKK